jgi:hypothetical protein
MEAFGTNISQFPPNNQPQNIPFHIFVKPQISPKTASTSTGPLSFDFLDLPPELQLLILEKCDPSTLFRLMHTSSSIRANARALFLSHPRRWYGIERSWILLDSTFPNFARLVPEFAEQAESLAFDFETNIVPEMIPGRDIKEVRLERASKFWSRIQTLFPSTKRILLSNSLKESPAYDMIVDGFAEILDLCPPQISLFLVRENHGSSCCLYRWNGSSEQLIRRDYSRITIEPPRRHISGLVGRYQRVKWKEDDLMYHQSFFMFMVTEMYDQFYFGYKKERAFQCPISGCDEWFQNAGSFREHITAVVWDYFFYEDNHQEYFLKSSEGYIPQLPSQLEDEIKSAREELETIAGSLSVLKRQLFAESGRKGSKKRKIYDQQFRDERMRNPCYDCPQPPEFGSQIYFLYRLQLEFGNQN